MTTAQLAERTGVAAPTLRMWEARHGFPSPARGPGGRRHYSQHDAERVKEVVRLREEGLSLTAAIRRATAAETDTRGSIFAGLVERRPDLRPMRLAKPALLSLSRAVEDEHCARGAGGTLVGAFQTVRFFRQSERRWGEVARTASLAVVLADFDRVQERDGGPTEVPIRHDDALAREWVIAFLAPGASACLAGWEVPDVVAGVDSARQFEVIWSPEPAAAGVAVTVAAELIADTAPRVAQQLTRAVDGSVPPPATADFRAAVAQAHRMLAYLAVKNPAGVAQGSGGR